MKHIGFFYTIVIILSIVVVYFSVYSNLSKSDSSLRDSTINKYSASSINGIDIQNQYKVISSKYFSQKIETARQHPRKRKMFDLTKDPNSNSMQILINTW
jgi:dolichyl-phosphate-mannose--protein O-mannosyl transferase